LRTIRIINVNIHIHHHHHHRLASVFSMLARLRRVPNIFLLHDSLSLVSSTFKPNIFISLLTHSLHVFLLLPLPTLPSTPRFKHFLTQSSSDFLSTCPYHLSLPCLTTSWINSIPRRSRNSSEE